MEKGKKGRKKWRIGGEREMKRRGMEGRVGGLKEGIESRIRRKERGRQGWKERK